MAVVLETRDLTKSFGMVRAVDGVSVRIQEGELVGVVGPNGSGKTTFLNLVTGYLRPDRGEILYLGRPVTGLPSRVLASLGLARSFQMPQLYLNLTAMENLLLALAIAEGKGNNPWQPLHTPERERAARRLLEPFGLLEYANRPVLLLPEGVRKLLDVALSVARRPRVLLMDEPTAGVSAREKFPVMDVLVEAIRREGMTALFVEHDMEVVERYAERVLVFFEGRILADGPPQEVLQERAVRRAVLGRE